jgi:probable HAF family extracellular repeat protein
MRKARAGLLILCLGILSSSAIFADQYQFIDLGPGNALSINNNGQIAGTSNGHAALFDPTGAGNTIDLGTYNGGSAVAYSISNNGQIVGEVDTSAINYAVRFDPTGAGNNINLGTLGGIVGGNWHIGANSINDNNQIVGTTYIYGQIRAHATLFDPTGAGHNIDIGLGYGSGAKSINNNGQIVGYSVFMPVQSHAALFDSTGAGHNIDLGTLGGASSGANYINDKGQVVGSADLSNGRTRAALFDPTGAGHNINLGTSINGGTSYANSINNQGQIVGGAYWSATGGCAILFDPTGTGNNIDLSTYLPANSGWTLYYANSINDNGWIVGVGMNPAGEQHAFLLKPIPEPGSLMLLLAGAGLCRLRRKA